MANSSNEALWQGDVVRRRRLIKFMALAVVIMSALAICAWAYLTQPLLSKLQPQPEMPQVTAARLETHVRMLSETFFPRDFEHTDNLDRAAQYIHSEFEKAKASVSDQRFQVHRKSYQNVIATYGPETQERIVVGAHYDSFGPNPAADDNASGIAGLIELAYILGTRPQPMRVDLVAYTLEEPPFFRTSDMGSAVHAASLRKQGVKVRAMLSLEMIGYFSDTPGSQHFPASIIGLMYPSTGNFIAVVGSVGEGMLVRRVKSAMTGFPVYSINAPGFVPGVDFSDHLNYWEAGYPAIMITDTAFYRNTAYHTPQDTANRLDYGRMAKVVQQVYAAVAALTS